MSRENGLPGYDNWLTTELQSPDPWCRCGHRLSDHKDEIDTSDATPYVEALKTIRHAINTERPIGVIEDIVREALALCTECDCQEFRDGED